MPLYKTIHISPDVVLHIWKISESEADLRKEVNLTAHSDRRVAGMRSKLHRKGFLSIRHLLHLEGYEDKDLFYDGMGKPHLNNGKHISITHSYEFTGIIVSRLHRVGIDIEKQREKIIRIAHKFTTLDVDKADENTMKIVRQLTKLWGSKESIYKISALPGLSFLQHIYIESEFDEKEWFHGEIITDENKSRFRISHLEFEGFTCVYAIKE